MSALIDLTPVAALVHPLLGAATLALLALTQAACGKYGPPERTRPAATTEFPEPHADPDRDDEEPRP